jgi:serralysin
MSERLVKCCIDYPRGGLDIPSYAALEMTKKWPPGQVLRVSFLDNEFAQADVVAQYAAEWSKFANITMDFSSKGRAHIRISFRSSGSWSVIGIDAFDVPSYEPTMNFGWLRQGLPQDEARAVVLHEFGHALGLIHEHQNPAGGIPWNKDAVYASLSGPPNKWDRAGIEHNMFETYNKDRTQYTVVDLESIMRYPIDPRWVTDPAYAVGFNAGLSDVDKAFIALQYPRD